MGKESITRISVSAILGATLCVMLLNRSAGSLGAGAQAADGGQNGVAPQHVKPFDQDQMLAELARRIKGRENQPAEEVFKNIQQFKGMPAARLLRVMNAYTRSLGVNCTHCHVVDEWEKEDKPTKQIARDMSRMVRAINNDLLKNIKNLKSESPVVNCTTCHRGHTKPEINLPEAKPKQ